MLHSKSAWWVCSRQIKLLGEFVELTPSLSCMLYKKALKTMWKRESALRWPARQCRVVWVLGVGTRGFSRRKRHLSHTATGISHKPTHWLASRFGSDSDYTRTWELMCEACGHTEVFQICDLSGIRSEKTGNILRKYHFDIKKIISRSNHTRFKASSFVETNKVFREWKVTLILHQCFDSHKIKLKNLVGFYGATGVKSSSLPIKMTD